MITLTEDSRGVILPVHAQPGARRNAVGGEYAGRLKVAVTQAAEKGKANDALIDVLATELGIKPSQLRLLSGSTSRQKTFAVSGLSLEVVQSRVTAILVSSTKRP